jgi:hypothetical protein
MKKKGYIFTVDVLVAVLIIVIGLIVLLGLFHYAPEKARTEELSNDIISLLSYVKVGDVCTIQTGSCSCAYLSLTDVCADVQDDSISLLELFGQLYYMNEREKIDPIVDELFIQSGILPQNFGLEIMLYNPEDPSNMQQLYPKVLVP